MADARDLKSLISNGVCGFESRRRHFFMCFPNSELNRSFAKYVALSVSFRTVEHTFSRCALPRPSPDRIPPHRKSRVTDREDLPRPEAFRRLLPAGLLSGRQSSSPELQLARCRQDGKLREGGPVIPRRRGCGSAHRQGPAHLRARARCAQADWCRSRRGGNRICAGGKDSGRPFTSRCGQFLHAPSCQWGCRADGIGRGC